ncbi:NADPH-dependent oxidoreductase [Acetobacter sp.]|jgi:nitroreductase|uniref:NADPH-dependent oxidoreductase n=1 Tax=Acetobacter sp. TaxID=440 RepID=UPI0025C05455|nr:NADPH-dependent oxidoreductase [Acetobacter sp.]MCH4091691.1 NADPH-dependent oxidoreductase [Acetobacter sp.]MCI1300891.1 NADPH-dependent oxidoreductase [Acetobacter sp.]MCI1316232.1 NADPH-dependent oxidoreductase [Acetobacter sp.]
MSDHFKALWEERYGTDVPAPSVTPDTVTESLLAHRTVRAYLNTPLPDGALEAAIAAAQSASTSSNMQIWSVVAIEDQARRDRLAALAGNQAHIREAPLLLVWLIDCGRLKRIGEAEGRPTDNLDYLDTFMVGAVDAGIAAQNAVASFEAVGLGIVYLGGMRNHSEEVARELNLPPLTAVAFGLSVGFPDPDRPAHIKPRLAQSVVLHREQYDASGEQEAITRYNEVYAAFQKTEGLPEKRWVDAILPRLASPKGLHGRERLREVLAKQGFGLR